MGDFIPVGKGKCTSVNREASVVSNGDLGFIDSRLTPHDSRYIFR